MSRASAEPTKAATARVSGGAVHKMPADLRNALIGNPTALALWNDITRLARNCRAMSQ